MVIKAAQEIWFEEREQTTNSSNFEALKISNQAEQFVAVLKGSSVQLPHMVTIIKKSLLDKNLQKSSLVHQRSNLRQRCEAMCKHMLEGLLKVTKVFFRKIYHLEGNLWNEMCKLRLM